MKVVLPSFLRYRTADDLIRLGRDNDGGYLVSAEDVMASDALIGFGINDDWSFESDFVLAKDVPVVAYDASVNGRIFLGRALSAVFHFKHPTHALYWLKAWASYRKFFRGQHVHEERFVGASDDGRIVSMQRVLEAAPTGMLFLKVDIEGSEYEILGEILNIADRTTGLVIELHECSSHVNEIQSFVANYMLPIVHVHANNFASVDAASDIPEALEITFSRNASTLGECVLPHPLDMPNDKGASDFVLTFA